MRYFLLICRILVGATFIVSGLVKANDPVGFGIKLEEYFEPSALNMTWAIPFALALGILACLGEVVLGFAVLVGGRMRLATTSILVLTLFFGWLTGYTWNCNARQQAGEKMTYTVVENGQEVEHDRTCVTDCGCFGDAMKGSLGRSLTPKESFFKDMILLVLLLPVFAASWSRKYRIAFNEPADDKVIIPGSLLVTGLWSWVFGWSFFLWFLIGGFAGYFIIKAILKRTVRAEWVTAIWIGLISFGFTYYTWQHLPLKDYRPYAVGKSIPDQKKNAKPPVENIYVIYKNKVSGEQKEFDSKGKYPWDDSTWVYVDRRVETVDPGVPSLVQDFSLTDKDGTNITEDVFNETSPILLIVVRLVDKADTKCMPAVNQLVDAAYKAGWYPYGVTASSYDQVEEFRHANQCGFDFLTCDEITLKTMIRSNPGVVLMQQGTIRGLPRLAALGVPVLAGLSRKRMINEVLGTKADEALNGTTVLNTIALLRGASILRVHDVKEAVDCVKLVKAFNAGVPA